VWISLHAEKRAENVRKVKIEIRTKLTTQNSNKRQNSKPYLVTAKNK
jgi:hypothetical protein